MFRLFWCLVTVNYTLNMYENTCRLKFNINLLSKMSRPEFCWQVVPSVLVVPTWHLPEDTELFSSGPGIGEPQHPGVSSPESGQLWRGKPVWWCWWDRCCWCWCILPVEFSSSRGAPAQVASGQRWPDSTLSLFDFTSNRLQLFVITTWDPTNTFKVCWISCCDS